MKTILYFLILFLAFRASAQSTDSVIVIFDSQKTIIPLPAIGKITSIKFQDSLESIEVGVSRYSSKLPIAIFQKTAKNIKWFSKIETGFQFENTKLMYFDGGEGNVSYYHDESNMIGYRVRISIREKEEKRKEDLSFISGWRLGFGQNFLKNNYYEDIYNPYDSTYQTVDVNHIKKTNTVLSLSFHYGIKYYINNKSNITISNSSEYSVTFFHPYNGIRRSWFTDLICPEFGYERGDFGLLLTTRIKFSNSQGIFEETSSNKARFGLSLTYRLF